MTEDEAKQKWCPFARVVRNEGAERGKPLIVGGVNRDALGGSRNPASCRCIGSECMAWRQFGEVGQQFSWPREVFDLQEKRTPGLYRITDSNSPRHLCVEQTKVIGECGLIKNS